MCDKSNALYFCVPVWLIFVPCLFSRVSILFDEFVFRSPVIRCVDQDSVAGSVIQASGMVLFEDGLKPGTLVVDIWSATSVRTTPVVNLAPHVRSHPDLGVQCGVEVA